MKLSGMVIELLTLAAIDKGEVFRVAWNGDEWQFCFGWQADWRDCYQVWLEKGTIKSLDEVFVYN